MIAESLSICSDVNCDHRGGDHVGIVPGNVYEGDCIPCLAGAEAGSVDLVFADPPFNIGYRYDVYNDKRGEKEYLDWSRHWMSGVWRVLKPNGAFWLAIGDEYAAELKVIAQRDVGFTCRSWVIWYYTFGVNCTRAFSRSHTHLLYFVKDPKKFTFNADNPAIRIPSARQLVYADGRANPKGRLPDNTWILRPQDIPDGFGSDHDTWYFPRVAGTFREREGFHGCQMPEQLLGRIIRCCSNPMEVVLDPFSGSGTTLAVAKKLGRQWIGFELSSEYVERIRARLRDAKVGGPLDGAADPLASAPATFRQRRTLTNTAENGERPAMRVRAQRRESGLSGDRFDKAIIEAYAESHAGFSLDHVLADPDLNATFLDACARKSLSGESAQWNRALLRIRKAGRLPRLNRRVRTFTFEDMDPYSFASEIALQQLSIDFDTTLDDILCDPALAGRFDSIAAGFAPGYTPFEYRWAALAIRKRAKHAKQLAKDHFEEWNGVKLPRSRPVAQSDWSKFSCPGVYLIISQNHLQLYVGETLNLQRRIEPIRELQSWKKLAPGFVKLLPTGEPCGLQSFLIHRVNPVLNSRLLVPDLRTVA
ncbi:MAG: site-specific DNA-methyltransferase [Pirellulales bacterium]|nr:site-specific DNA-methyltransferase [Pirellulales bacterium]